MQIDEIERFRLQLEQVKVELDSLNELILALRSQKTNLGWFVSSSVQSARQRVQLSTRDALNHAAAFIGYFDGFEARGAFQIRTQSESERRKVENLSELLDYLEWVIVELRSVVSELSLRKTLILFQGGPKKPGPHRTAAFCLAHLKSLEQVFRILFQNVASNENILPLVEAQLIINLP